MRNTTWRWSSLVLAMACGLGLVAGGAEPAATGKKPPLEAAPPAGWTFPVAKLETLKPSAAEVLVAPEKVSGDFTIAQTPPVIDWGLLPGQWRGGRLWSNWGDSLFASDGDFYCSIGDHRAPHGYAYVYRVNPATREARMIVDVEKELQWPKTDYAPGKVHGPLLEREGWVYFATYRGSGEGGGGIDDAHHYRGDPLFRYEMATGRIETLPVPADFCSVPAASIHTPSQMLLGLGAGGQNRKFANVFFVYDLKQNKPVFVGGPQPNQCRALLVAPDGRAYYSSGPETHVMHGNKFAVRPGTLAKYDPKTRQAALTDLKVPGDGMMRAASRCNAQGVAYGISTDGVVFTFDTANEKMAVVGKTFEVGAPYTAVCKLSPDERFLYFVPGAHSGGPAAGCPIVQMDTRTGRRKVLAFVYPYLMKQKSYHTGGTFGIDISPDGATLGICFNGRKEDEPPVSVQSLPHFDQCSVMLLHIPESER